MKKRYFILTAFLWLLNWQHIWAQNDLPLRLVMTTELPDVTGGDFDHFAVDLKGNRLFVVSEVYASIEVFDLHTGVHLQSATGVVKSPRKIIFLEDKGELLVADSGSSSCLFLDAKDLHVVASVPLEPGPDAGIYDPGTRSFYVGNGGRAAHLPFAYISEISVDSRKVVRRIRVEGSTLKTVLLDPSKHRLYVTLRDVSKVAVIDVKHGTVEKTWDGSELHMDSAMAFDQAHHRIFVGDRDPGKLVVLDSADGRYITSLPIGNTSDDMQYDERSKRLFIASADGVDVVLEESPDKYRLIQHVDTMGGKTCIYVPSLKKLYVVHTKGAKANVAALQIFEVR